MTRTRPCRSATRTASGHLLARGNMAGRVPGVAEEERGRPRSDRRARAPRDPSATRPPGWSGRRRASRPRADRALEEEARGRHDDLVARPSERAEAEREGVHRAVRDDELAVRGRRRAPSTVELAARRRAARRAREAAVRPSAAPARPRRPRRRGRAARATASRAAARPRLPLARPPRARARPRRWGTRPPSRRRRAAGRARGSGPCAGSSARPPPCACRCRRPRRCSGCARSAGSSSS